MDEKKASNGREEGVMHEKKASNPTQSDRFSEQEGGRLTANLEFGGACLQKSTAGQHWEFESWRPKDSGPQTYPTTKSLSGVLPPLSRFSRPTLLGQRTDKRDSPRAARSAQSSIKSKTPPWRVSYFFDASLETGRRRRRRQPCPGRQQLLPEGKLLGT